MPRYGHRSDPHTQVAEILMMASVGSTIVGVSRALRPKGVRIVAVQPDELAEIVARGYRETMAEIAAMPVTCRPQ